MSRGQQSGFFRRVCKSALPYSGRTDLAPSARKRGQCPLRLNVESLEERTLLAVRAVGPVDPVTGFPKFYQDSNGLALEQCLVAPVENPADPCGLGPIRGVFNLPNPAAPVSVPDNFPVEVAYTFDTALMTTNGGGKALFVMAYTGFFPSGAAFLDGDQTTFARIRFRVDNMVPGETYTITHPYGVDVFTNVAGGRRGINFTEDIGLVPIRFAIPGVFDPFALPLESRADPFLKWDPAVAPAAPAGFIGDGVLPHKVVGSPFGTNFFRIAGPNIGGAGVNSIQTDLFTVIGKIAFGNVSGMQYEDLNGNGAKDAGEPGLTGGTINLTGTDALGNLVNRTTTTSADNPATPVNEAGTYVFSGMDPGTYTVSEILPTAPPVWVQSAPAGGTHTVTLTTGVDAANLDFGNYRLGAIQGLKFEDLNRNGAKAANEPGLAGWTIMVTGTDGSGNPVNPPAATTAADGTYSFADLPPGSYTISEVQQTDWSQTAPTGGTHSVTLTSGQTATGKNFGNIFGNAAVLQADPFNSGKSVLRVLGTRGNDSISVSQAASGVSVTINGRKYGPFDPNVVSRIIARGLDGNDSISLSSRVTLPAWLDGGIGNDNLTGGGGRDIMVGGLGKDQLKSSNNDDIYIAGRYMGGSTMDALDSALAGIMSDWSSNLSYGDRVSRLATGSGSGQILNNTTVLADAEIDTLTDGSGSDWFFRETRDKLLSLNRNAGQRIDVEG